MTEAEKAARIRALQDQGVRLGVRWEFLPGARELLDGDDGGEARRKLERRQEFAARYGFRLADVPDLPMFRESEE